MEKEIKDLTKQRDLAESRVKDLLLMIGQDENSRKGVYLFANTVLHLLIILIQLMTLAFNS